VEVRLPEKRQRFEIADLGFKNKIQHAGRVRTEAAHPLCWTWFTFSVQDAETNGIGKCVLSVIGNGEDDLNLESRYFFELLK
jgi:hypothetical protein